MTPRLGDLWQESSITQFLRRVTPPLTLLILICGPPSPMRPRNSFCFSSPIRAIGRSESTLPLTLRKSISALVSDGNPILTPPLTVDTRTPDSPNRRSEIEMLPLTLLSCVAVPACAIAIPPLTLLPVTSPDRPDIDGAVYRRHFQIDAFRQLQSHVVIHPSAVPIPLAAF